MLIVDKSKMGKLVLMREESACGRLAVDHRKSEKSHHVIRLNKISPTYILKCIFALLICLQGVGCIAITINYADCLYFLVL